MEREIQLREIAAQDPRLPSLSFCAPGRLWGWGEHFTRTVTKDTPEES